jgi:hypothetical protein
MQSIFGSIVFEVIGAGTKWLYFKIRNFSVGQPGPLFKDIYGGREKKGSAEYLYGGISNIAIGMVVVVILAYIFVELTLFFQW